ncbi:MAG: hypothetical protein ACRD2T_11870, partial [Thermoanaerobaculia bacterium]
DPLNINLWSSGADIWGTADEGRMVDFGDFDRFDIQCLVAALDPVNPWTKAGLMARSVVADASSPYAFICATGSNGTDFQYRDDPVGNAANRGATGAGNLLRELRLLRRTGDVVEAFARNPGEARWRLLGTRNMPNLGTFVGIAITSHDLNAVAGARFENIRFTDVPPPALAPVTDLACKVQGGKAQLAFTPPAGATAIEILKDGVVRATLAAGARSYDDPVAITTEAMYAVVAYGGSGLPGPASSCLLSPCHENQQDPQAELVQALAFSHWPVDCPTQNDPSVNYTVVRHEFNDPTSVDFLLYDPARGWGYEVLYPDPADQPSASVGVFGVFGPLDNTPNNRNLYPDACPEQLYDSFIGAKNFLQTCDAARVGNPNDPCTAGGLRPEGIIFRLDLPNGIYRFVAAVGSPDNPHAHRILAEDGGEGLPEFIGENHVVLVSNHDQAQTGAGVYARVGFDGKIPPPGDGVGASPRFVNMDENGLATTGCASSPILEVTQGYLRIHQLQGNSNAGPGSSDPDPNGADLVVLELWRTGPAACPVAGDTHCTDLNVTGPADNGPGRYTATASATDDAKDNEGEAIRYRFRAERGAAPPLVVGPHAGNSAVFDLSAGSWTISVTVDDDPGCGDVAGDATCSKQVAVQGTAGGILPGDCNGDGRLDLSDGICLLLYLFLGSGQPLPCGDGTLADPASRSLVNFNGDQGVDLSDAIGTLNYLFLTGAPHA